MYNEISVKVLLVKFKKDRMCMKLKSAIVKKFVTKSF